MAITEFTKEQTETIHWCKDTLTQIATKLQKVDNELFELGSFPESPVGHTAWELENTANYIKMWLDDKGVEI